MISRPRVVFLVRLAGILGGLVLFSWLMSPDCSTFIASANPISSPIADEPYSDDQIVEFSSLSENEQQVVRLAIEEEGFEERRSSNCEVQSSMYREIKYVRYDGQVYNLMYGVE
jgi:hypothetical protein